MLRLLLWPFKLALGLALASAAWAALYAVLDPPATYIQLRDRAAGRHIERDWRALDQIDVDLPRAVIAAEDARFCAHNGFDVAGIEAAMKANARGRKLRGGSTVSQQTAKNVFLWPERSWLRKGLEAWFTFLIEQLWGKRRIMEVYLNVVELGRGVYGAEAGARHYYGKSAAKLSEREASRLAAILPQPIKRSAATPGGYTRRYAGRIDRRIDAVRRDGLDRCLRAPREG